MKRKIKVLYVTAEISPYANAGGLGEVGRSFAKGLEEAGNIEVRRVMPLYKNITGKMKYLNNFPVAMGKEFDTCVVRSDSENKDIITYFIENDRYFYRDNIYGYEDDGLRFFFFCRAVVEMLKVIPYKPDIIHTNDWHTGFLPLLIQREFPNIKTVYTIHNIAYQGFVPPIYLEDILSETEIYQLGWPEWLNFMKAGIIYSDLLTTVSPGYCEEIVEPLKSFGMSSLIEQRRNGMIGILNGIDTKSYDPAKDGVLEYPFDVKSIEDKKKNRTALRLKYDLPDTEVPLISMVTRLDYVKGIDLLIKVLHRLDLKTFQLIILGTGNPYYQGMLSNMASEYSDNLAVDFNYSSDLAKTIYAASDINLMPSQSEPCGLGQMYAMRYGAVPIVNPVGGLKDTVIEDTEHPQKSTGFYMEEWSGEALATAIQRAIEVYHTAGWNALVKNGMKFDFSWKRSISEYKKLYEELLNKPSLKLDSVSFT